MNRTLSFHTLLTTSAVVALMALLGCVDDEVATSTQQLTGTVSADSDAERPDIVAVDEMGTPYLFETGANGAFRIALPVGHTYELFVNEHGTQGLEQANKVVFPRTNGDFDHRVHVSGAMDPFDMGEVRAAGTPDTAHFQVEQALSEEQDDPEATECADGPPGLFCVHDGVHPGCEGLTIAATNRAQAGNQASNAPPQSDEGSQIAEEARQAAERNAEQADAGAEYIPDDSDQESLDDNQPIALPQIPPPFEFPGCDAG